MPTLQATLPDAQVQYKAGMALALCEMSTIVGKDFCISTILPIIEKFLTDESSEVRLNVAQNLGKLARTVGPELLSASLTQQLTTMTKDSQWRVRMAIFELLG